MRTMIPKCTTYLLLMCGWSSFLGLDGQPTVQTEFLTPEANRKEGGEVRMRCTAASLQQDQLLEWRTANRTMSWGDILYAHGDQRYSIQSEWPMIMVEFSITDLQRKDANDYICNVRIQNPAGGSQIMATAKLTLLVLYFPNESFPVCSPAGPITVLPETLLQMKCSSEIANPEVVIDVTNNNQTRAFSWSSLSVDNSALWSLDLTVGVSENGLQFTCTVTSPMYFQGMSRSCTIGPIHARTLTTDSIPTTEPTPLQSTQATPNPPVSTSTAPAATVTTPTVTPGFTTSILVGSLAGGVALLLLILVIYAMCLCNRKPKPHTTMTKTESVGTETTPQEPRLKDDIVYENTDLRAQPIPEEPEIYQNVHHNTNLECRLPDSVKKSKPTDSTRAVDRSSFYAKPNKVRKKTLDSTEKRLRQASGVSSYFNPVFDSGDLDGDITSRISTVDVIPKSQTRRRASRTTEDQIYSDGYSKPDIQMLPSEEGTATKLEHRKGGRHVRIITPDMDNGENRKSRSSRHVDNNASHSEPPEQTGTRRPSVAVAYAEINLLSGIENGRRLAPTDSPEYEVLNESS